MEDCNGKACTDTKENNSDEGNGDNGGTHDCKEPTELSNKPRPPSLHLLRLSATRGLLEPISPRRSDADDSLPAPVTASDPVLGSSSRFNFIRENDDLVSSVLRESYMGAMDKLRDAFDTKLVSVCWTSIRL